MQLTPRIIIYGVLAVLGLVLPWYFNIQFMMASGGSFDLMSFIEGSMANFAASSITMDIFIAGITYIVWLFPEAKTHGIRHAWIYLILMMFVAFAFAFPLFLLVREIKMQKNLNAS